MKIDMTQEELKKLDKRIRSINDPFGTGYPCLKKIYRETAASFGISEREIVLLHAAWKASHDQQSEDKDMPGD